MFKKLFGLDKKAKNEAASPQEELIYAPLNGTLVDIEDVPDPTFAQKMMGDGFAIDPRDGHVVAPVAGEIVQVFPTKHAVGIKTPGGAELLIHIGLETVNMKGEGFTAHVKEGDKVNVGDALVDFDLELVKEKAESTVTPVVVTNIDQLAVFEKQAATETKAGETSLVSIKVQG
ncbi:PTS sugar transporter subunit IIA [Halalkalibacterium halodurans]|uniref:PTS glucose transporter subunit IIA n=1 Tax=Halalkalibacterium halodurans TaxID=86665 RepID=A0A0M0KL15_ALKHA|nr:PTS glucose transporter subunit IIA [Halalkalibacterium halodurans]MED4164264.1 PTS glucose transporter subunit IIA [Halalkalibacterium halodurans]TPE70450.1 PTS glucose transporter subunit IIA [Halalkalibacterium halodurans]